jgi:integrase
MAWVEKKGNKYRLCARVGKCKSDKRRTPYIEMDERLRSMTPKQLKKELYLQAMRYEDELNSRRNFDEDKLTFKDIVDIWWEDYATQELERKTLAEYETYLARILHELGHYKLCDLRPKDFTDFYRKLKSDGIRRDQKYVLKSEYTDQCKTHRAEILANTGIHPDTMSNLLKGGNTTAPIADKLSRCIDLPIDKLFDTKGGEGGLSHKTIRHHHRVITAIYNKAIHWEITTSNPAMRAQVPKVETKEANAYNVEQAIQMFRLLANEPLKYQAAIYVALYGGLRLGEVTGLDWISVDFHAKTVSVTKARQYVKKHGTYDKKPKTAKSVRTITLSNDAMYILEEHRKEQERERHKLGDHWVESGKIFVQQNGEPMFPQRPSTWFSNWMKRTGLPKITFHQLRHTHASILISKGVDIASVSRNLGHSNIQTTISTYVHAFKEAGGEIANVLNDVLSPELGMPAVKLLE